MAMLIPEAWAGHLHMKGRQACVLRISRIVDGTVGRSGCDRVHRRSSDWRHARSQRFTSRALRRHSRWIGCACIGSGCSRYPPAADKTKGRLQPGKMFLVDTVEGRIVSDKEIKKRLASRQPYAQWLRQNQIMLDKLPEPQPRPRVGSRDHLVSRSVPLGTASEDLSMILVADGPHGRGTCWPSMGNDTPLACLSDQPQNII